MPRTPPARARALNGAGIRASLAMLGSLDAAAWSRPTACTGRTVRDTVAHEVGRFEELPRPWLMVMRVRRARRTRPGRGAPDGHNASQVEDRGGVPGERPVRGFARIAPKGARSLARVPAPVRRRIRTSMVFPEARALPEDSLEYMNSVLLARDTWTHRIDISDATGTEPVLDAHDREIMRRVLLDPALGWTGPPCLLDPSGPIGGRYRIGTGPRWSRRGPTPSCPPVTCRGVRPWVSRCSREIRTPRRPPPRPGSSSAPVRPACRAAGARREGEPRGGRAPPGRAARAGGPARHLPKSC
ncbi:maleylpyruvate isomerase N-terminal domain-containing protein [Streptomyces sp. NPDC085946]|uniref:maleylpyruvate isomerase N-terminal domain-containing protein n=1 Tax=Streptomyces sp. NPDC085946 TaxID=3365744 RepID=UPI0037CD6380